MALKFNLTTDDGIEHPNAYLRIREEHFEWTINKGPEVKIDSEIYHDSETRNAGKTPIKVLSHIVPLADYEQFFSETVLSQEGVTIRINGYKFLHTLVEYENAEDLL